MGYYENPPIIQPDRSGLMIADSIIKSSESISKGIMMAGERKREEEKERKLTIQKLQDQKNKTDLLYNEKISDWSKTQSKGNPEVTKKVYALIDSKIKLAADSQIALLTETDTEKRNEYLKNIRTADSFLNNSAEFGKAVAMDTATWREAAKALKVGVSGGYVINGKSDKEILDNTAAIEVLGGMEQAYKDTSIDVMEDSQGDGVVMRVRGKREDGSSFDVIINSKDYLSSDTSGNGGLLLPVESLDDFYKEAKKDVVDDKGNIYTGYINEKRETVDLPSSGRDVYQLRNGQRLQDKAIKAKISEQSNIRAEGIIANYNPSNLRTLIDYTLGNQPGYYDKNFKALTPAAQKEELSKMLTNKSFDGMTRSLEKTKDANGDTVYWNPSADISIKPKEGKGGSGSGTSDKEEPSTYKEEYYNSIITGLDPSKKDKDPAMAAYQERSSLVENLNKLSGSNKFATRDELFNRWKKQEYKSGDYATGKTMEEHYKEEGKNITNAFAKLYPFQNGYVYVEKSANNFVPVKGYNINKATDRVKLALDQTSDAGERKILQKKLKDARLMDWMKINTRKSNETTEQYAARARKAGF
jgi:hypothetical protein